MNIRNAKLKELNTLLSRITVNIQQEIWRFYDLEFAKADDIIEEDENGSFYEKKIFPKLTILGKDIRGFKQKIRDCAVEFQTLVDEDLDLIFSPENKKDYLQKLKSQLSMIDVLIENKNGRWIHKNATINDPQSLFLERFYSELSDLYFEIKSLVDQVIKELDKRINDLDNEPTTKSHPTLITGDQPDKKRVYSVPRRFILTNYSQPKDNITSALKVLKKHGFVSSEVSSQDFHSLFYGDKVKNPIKWIGSKGQLRYFVKKLEKELIVNKLTKNKWEAIAIFFRDQYGKRFDPKRLADSKLGNDEIKFLINEAIFEIEP